MKKGENDEVVLRTIILKRSEECLQPVVVAIVLADDRHVCGVVGALIVVDIDLAHTASEKGIRGIDKASSYE